MKPCWKLVAAVILTVCLAIAPLTAMAQDASLAVARQDFDSGRYAAAVTALQEIVAKNSRDAEANYWQCRSFYEIHDFDHAIAQCEQAVRLSPQNSDYHLWLGRAYGEKADRQHSFFMARKVKHEFEEAVRLDPRNIPARRDLAEFYAEAPWIVGGNKDGAKEQIDAIAAMDPIQGHLARAQFWDDQKRYDLAEAQYRQVLTEKPSNITDYFEAADFYAARGRAPELKSIVDAAAALKPSDPRLAYYRGVEDVLSGGSLSAAEQNLKSYLASTPSRSDWPSHASAREWLGRLYEAEGKRGEAAEQYRAALQLDPGRSSAQDRLKHLEQNSK